MTEGRILDVVPVGIVVLDRSYQVTEWNRWMEIHSGIKADTIVGTSIFNHYPSLNKASFLRACKSVFTFGSVVYLSQKLHKYIFPFALGASSGDSGVTHMQQSGTMTPVKDDAGEVQRVVITIQDVTDSVILERRLRQLTQVDSLTGTFNRRYFDKRLAEEFRRHRRFKRPLSVIVMDLDHFKAINDRFGHQVGDHVLRSVCDVAQAHLREVDMLFRYGGEEFAGVLPETDAPEAVRVAERIRAAIDGHEFLNQDETVNVTVSFGVSTVLSSTKDSADLFHQADQALYAAKENGRNQVQVAQSTPVR